MVSFVVISHSALLANGVCEEAKMMAPDVNIIPAGGTRENGLGTDYETVTAALEKAYTDDGVIIFVDMGSAVMTATLAIEDFDRDNVVIADCPILEGAVLGAILADSGSTMDEILDELKEVANQKKLDL